MTLLQHYAARAAQRRPEAPAVSLGDDRLTYAELDARSDRLARLLAEAGCTKGDRVAILVPKSPLAVLCVQAVLKAGCLYVPIDPESPAERIRRVLDAAECRIVLAAGRTGPILVETGRALAAAGRPLRVGWMDGPPPAELEVPPVFLAADADAMPAGAPPVAATPDDAAEILFTSGSTGVPKGVVIGHRSVAAFTDWAVGHFGIVATDRCSGHSPLHFDLSSLDMYGTFAAGAELCLVPADVNVLPKRLPEFMRAARLTQWFSVPSALVYAAKFDAVAQDDFPELKRLMWCGEVFPPHALAYWIDRLPHVAFTNLYGPTEATIASSWYALPKPRPEPLKAVPIGRPCPGEAMLVLDAGLKPLPAGETGEIFIAGVGLAEGYWRDPAKTDAAFLPSPDPALAAGRIYRTGDLGFVDADGLVHFVGRADTQIKSRGHRIELGEIEAALDSLPDLAAAAVVAVETEGFEGTEICCAYVDRDPAAETPPRALRTALGRLVPRYMLPHRFVRLERMPANANGKIDRARLKTLFREGAGR